MSILLLLVLVGCESTQPAKTWDGSGAYEDVTVPADFVPYDNPPYRREDSKAGKRIYGVYSYRSREIYSPKALSEWLKIELPRHDWKFVNEEVDLEKSTFKARFEKNGDKLDFSMAPDRLNQSSERFSILVVKMNDPNSN
ncbi:MAG: hypothetical protein IT462_17685 [Planctomycetes bacterium]|nr:hypothetical protein [Planctomycetota bacterium]